MCEIQTRIATFEFAAKGNQIELQIVDWLSFHSIWCAATIPRACWFALELFFCSWAIRFVEYVSIPLLQIWDWEPCITRTAEQNRNRKSARRVFFICIWQIRRLQIYSENWTLLQRRYWSILGRNFDWYVADNSEIIEGICLHRKERELRQTPTWVLPNRSR